MQHCQMYYFLTSARFVRLPVWRADEKNDVEKKKNNNNF